MAPPLTGLAHLKHLIAGFNILNEDLCTDFTTNLLINISIGVDRGEWNEEKYPEEFAELKVILNRHRAWYLLQTHFIAEVKSSRKIWPRTHWWWWIEEL